MGSGSQKAHEAIAIAPSPPTVTDVEDSTAVADHEVLTDGCAKCGAPLDDGEGWNGLCGNCADIAEYESDVADYLAEAGTDLVDGTGLNDDGSAATAPTPAEDPVAKEDRPPAPEGVDFDLDATPPVDTSEVLTPVPADPDVGDMAGHPLIVGGDDLDDASLTLVSYADAAGGEPREVLYGWVNPEAEHKVLDALALDEEKLVPVEVTKEINGRLPLDEEHNLYGQLEKVAKSVNHHLKAGDGIPQHTLDNTEKLWTQLSGLYDAATADEKEMISVYLGAIEQITPKLDPAYDEPYSTGKLAHIDPHTVNQTVTVTEMVPAPAEDTPDGLLAAKIRDTTRIKPTLDKDGQGSWNGSSRYSGQGGKEYRIDLGDGYEAIYRPHNATSGDSAHLGQRGFLEIVAPPGAGHGPEMVERLGQLNLVNRPMTAAEAEWTYLQRNIWAQRLDQDKNIANTVAAAKTLDDTVAELVFSEKAHQAIGMNDAQLARFAKSIQLEAEARALPEKTRMVREAVASHLGFASGQDLAESAGYNPIPRRTAGWYTWDRFDVAGDPDTTTSHFGSRVLYHRVTANNIADIFANSGALVATERRRVMGIQPNIGMSEGSDMTSGGSRVVDLRIGSKPPQGPVMVWNNPTRLLRRADWYAYDGDHFAASADVGGWSTKGQTRDPAKVAGFKKGNNEILFRNGIDLTGSEAPDHIRCSSTAQRDQVLAVLDAKGISTLGGRSVKEVVTI